MLGDANATTSFIKKCMLETFNMTIQEKKNFLYDKVTNSIVSYRSGVFFTIT